MPAIDEETAELREELARLAERVRNKQEEVRDNTDLGKPGSKPGKTSVKKLLKGHINKVTCVHFSGDSRHAVSGSLDGKLIVWDCWTGNKTQVIPLSGNMVACGGMDNMLTIYDLNNRDAQGSAKMVREVTGYEGFLSSARFIDDDNIITGSGQKVLDLQGHNGDVAALSLNPTDPNTFITGSVDRTARMWDLRAPGCVQTFWGHHADVNSVSVHPSGVSFVTCSEDKTVRLWDIRGDQEVCQYKPPTPNSSFTSVGVSMSGRLVLASSDDSTIHMWDVTGTHLGNLGGHENRITQIAVAPAGFAIASSSWDQSVRVWGL